MEIITCLKAYFKGENLTPIEDDETLVKIAREQALLPYLYPVYKKDSYKRYYVSAVMQDGAMSSVASTVCDVLSSHSIKHVLLKGSVFKKYYPDAALRTRGDIDIYVDPSKIKEAEASLINIGFTKKDSNAIHHISLMKDKIEVELHYSLVDVSEAKRIKKLFENPFEMSTTEDNISYEMKLEYHILYALWHFKHHLRYGAGIRYVIDFYYLLGQNIDFKMLGSLIDAYSFRKLYNNILNVIYKLTEKKLDNIEPCDIGFFIDYMLSYGVHGNSNNEDDMVSSIHESKLKYFFSKVFLTNKAYRKSRYKILGSHWFLYPICLIKHIICLVFRKTGQFFKLIFKPNKKKKLYKRLGI